MKRSRNLQVDFPTFRGHAMLPLTEAPETYDVQEIQLSANAARE